jgi:hypothetical protein
MELVVGQIDAIKTSPRKAVALPKGKIDLFPAFQAQVSG